jgi:hypothetical protein
VRDCELPTCNAPATRKFTRTSSSGISRTDALVQAWLASATANDNCATSSFTNNAPATFPIGSTLVTWTARDAGGNQRQCSSTATVE